MAFDAGTAYVKVEPLIDEGFDRKVESQLGARFNRIGSRLSTAGSKLTRGLTLPIAAASVGLIKLASDAGETENKVRVTFEGMASSILKWSDTSIERMGLASQTAQDFASQLGLIFQAADLPSGAVVDLSKKFTQLAADMSSFFNVPVAEALGALRSGLVGETEPLRRFGVLLSEARLQSVALREGLVGQNEELSEQAKVQARAIIIQESLTKASGDYVRTSDSVANKTRATIERFKEMGAELGTKLLPVADQLLEVVSGMLESFSKLSPSTQTNILKMLALAAALGPVVRLLGGMFSITGSLLKAGPALVGFFTKLGGASVAANAGLASVAGTTGTVATKTGLLSQAFLLGVGRAAAYGGALLAVGLAVKSVIDLQGQQADRTSEVDRQLRLGIGTSEEWRSEAQKVVDANSGIVDAFTGQTAGANLARDAINEGTEAFERYRAELDLMDDASRLTQARAAVAGLREEFRRGNISFDVYQQGLENIRDTYTLFFPAGERLIEQQKQLITGLGQFADEVLGATGITDAQRHSLESLIPAYRKAEVRIDASTRATIEGLIASGNYGTAITLLEGAIEKGLGPALRRHKDDLTKAETAAIAAAIKTGDYKTAMDLLAKAIKNVPKNTNADVTVRTHNEAALDRIKEDLIRIGGPHVIDIIINRKGGGSHQHGGTIRDWGFVGEAGPEVAIHRPGGTDIIPMDSSTSARATLVPRREGGGRLTGRLRIVDWRTGLAELEAERDWEDSTRGV